mmetsp:Transcript_6031/g.13133  ORF Transcript_6031/g.13133 Transcript_6031/m.13133 type:complete len:208 (+) Transcript_6031:245-868(+)
MISPIVRAVPQTSTPMRRSATRIQSPRCPATPLAMDARLRLPHHRRLFQAKTITNRRSTSSKRRASTDKAVEWPRYLRRTASRTTGRYLTLLWRDADALALPALVPPSPPPALATKMIQPVPLAKAATIAAVVPIHTPPVVAQAAQVATITTSMIAPSYHRPVRPSTLVPTPSMPVTTPSSKPRQPGRDIKSGRILVSPSSVIWNVS